MDEDKIYLTKKQLEKVEKTAEKYSELFDEVNKVLEEYDADDIEQIANKDSQSASEVYVEK